MPRMPLLVLLSVISFPVARAEMIEEIVAWVNSDIITQSEYEDEQQAVIAELYRAYTGAELDQRLEEAQQQLLMQMIDRKILVHHAKALGYDLDEMGNVFFQSFKQDRMASLNIESEEEFYRLMEQQGLTEIDMKRSLVETYAPEEVIRFEVMNRVSASDAEVEAYYNETPDQFEVPAQVTLREIVLLADGPASRAERREEAAALQQRAESEDFVTLVREYSESGTKDNDGLLGPMQVSDLSDDLATPAITLPVGGVSPVIELDHGFHIIRVEERTERYLKPLEEVRDRLRVAIEDRKRRIALGEFLEQARSESEWCVKPKYEALLSVEPPDSCQAF